MSFETLMAGQPAEEYPLNCPFRFMGCALEFDNAIEQRAHARKCIRSTFITCRFLSCFKNDLFVYASTEDLMQHAIHEHGAFAMNREGSFLLEVGLPTSFLSPGRNSFKSFVLGQTNVYIGGVTYRTGVMLICMLGEDPDDKPELLIVPVKLQPNTNYVHYLIKVLGKEDTIIPTMLHPAKMSYGRSSELTTIQAFNSPMDFFVNTSSSRIPRYAVEDILQLGKHNATGNFVTVKFEINAKIMRCKVQVHEQGQLQPFAQFWEDLKLDVRIQSKMTESYGKQPATLSKIIIPQIKSGGTVIVESRYDLQSKNAIVAGILDHVNYPGNQTTSTSCRCIVLMPSKTMLENEFSAWWSRYIRDTHMTIFQMETVTSNLVQQFKSTGATVIMSTLSDLISLLDTKDDQIQSLLKNDLRHLHIHYPDRFPIQGLKALYNKLGLMAHQYTKSAYSELVSDEVRLNLVQNVGFKNALFLSLGSNPRILISRHIMNMKSEESFHLRCIKANHYIQQEEQVSGPKRWLIFVRSTVLPNIDILKLAFENQTYIRSVTFFTTHEKVRKNSRFFTQFISSNNGILVLPYDGLDFEQVSFGEILLLLEEPQQEWETNLVRLIVQSVNVMGSVKPIKMFSPREDGYVQL